MRRNSTRLNWWNVITSIRGFDEGGEGGSGEGGTGDGATGGQGDGQSGSTEGGEGGEGGQGDGDGSGAKYSDSDVAGLKSALQKERDEKKTLDKELKAFRKAKQEKDDSEKTEVQRLTEAQQRDTTKLQKLAQGYKDNAINQAILKAAGNAKFTDPSDALRPEVLSAIGVEQDEDDPTQVTIDEATVTAAVKALAKSKPHYLTTAQGGNGGGNGSGTKSGSKFGGGSGNGGGDDAGLAAKYPALARRLG